MSVIRARSSGRTFTRLLLNIAGLFCVMEECREMRMVGEHFVLDILEDAEAAEALCRVFNISFHTVPVLVWTVTADVKQSLSQELPHRTPSAHSLLAKLSLPQSFLPILLVCPLS